MIGGWGADDSGHGREIISRHREGRRGDEAQQRHLGGVWSGVVDRQCLTAGKTNSR